MPRPATTVAIAIALAAACSAAGAVHVTFYQEASCLGSSGGTSVPNGECYSTGGLSFFVTCDELESSSSWTLDAYQTYSCTGESETVSGAGTDCVTSDAQVSSVVVDCGADGGSAALAIGLILGTAGGAILLLILLCCICRCCCGSSSKTIINNNASAAAAASSSTSSSNNITIMAPGPHGPAGAGHAGAGYTRLPGGTG